MHFRIGLVTMAMVHVPRDAAGALPLAVDVWDMAILLVVSPPHVQQALSKHPTFMGVVVDLTTPVALAIQTWLRLSPCVSRRC
jgi:hypothetical protein